MKQLNLLVVLNLLRSRGAMSRAELTRALNCDGTTITNIIRELMEHDLVISRGAVLGSRPGRPKELLELNLSVKQAIGISFDPRFISGVVTDLSGKIIFHEELYFENGISQKKLLSLLQSLCARLQENVSRKRLIGVGVSTFGLLLPGENIVRNAVNFPAFENFDMMDYFTVQFKMPPVILDGISSKVMTELWHSREEDEKKSFILIDAGTGIGAGIVARGELLNSEKGGVGEFGHIVCKPDGKPCKCGMNGCLETLVSISAIEDEAGDSWDAVAAKYQAGDKSVLDIVDKSAEWFGMAIANLINLLLPEKIILSGPLLELGDRYFDSLRKNAEKFTFPAFREKNALLMKSRFSSEAAAQGAAISLLQKYFNGKIPF